MDDIWTWVAWAVGLLGVSLAIKANVKFDVNEWLKERRRQKDESLRALCPHARWTEENGKVEIHVAYVSPSGTLAWQCQMCGRVTHDDREIEHVGRYWQKNPRELISRHERIRKFQKKLGRR